MHIIHIIYGMYISERESVCAVFVCECVSGNETTYHVYKSISASVSHTFYVHVIWLKLPKLHIEYGSLIDSY